MKAKIILLILVLLLTQCNEAKRQFPAKEQLLCHVTVDYIQWQAKDSSTYTSFLLWRKIKNTTGRNIFFYDPAIIIDKIDSGKYWKNYEWLSERSFIDMDGCAVPYTYNSNKIQTANQSRAFSDSLNLMLMKKLDNINKSTGLSVATFYFLRAGETIELPSLVCPDFLIPGNYNFSVYGTPDLLWSPWNLADEIQRKKSKIPATFENFEYWPGLIVSDTISMGFYEHSVPK